MNAGLIPSVGSGSAPVGGSSADGGRPKLNDAVFHTILATVLGADADGSAVRGEAGTISRGGPERRLRVNGDVSTEDAIQFAEDGAAGAALQSPAQSVSVDVEYDDPAVEAPGSTAADAVTGTDGHEMAGRAAGTSAAGVADFSSSAVPGQFESGLQAVPGIQSALDRPRIDAVLPPPHEASAPALGFGSVTGRDDVPGVAGVGVPGVAGIDGPGTVGTVGLDTEGAVDSELRPTNMMRNGIGFGTRTARALSERGAEVATALSVEGAADANSSEDEQVLGRVAERRLTVDDVEAEADVRSQRAAVEAEMNGRIGEAEGGAEADARAAADARGSLASSRAIHGDAELSAHAAEARTDAPRADVATDGKVPSDTATPLESGGGRTGTSHDARARQAVEPDSELATASTRNIDRNAAETDDAAQPSFAGRVRSNGASEEVGVARGRTDTAGGVATAASDDGTEAGRVASGADVAAPRRSVDVIGAGSANGRVEEAFDLERVDTGQNAGHDAGNGANDQSAGRDINPGADARAGYPGYVSAAGASGSTGVGSAGHGALSGDALGESVASQLRSPMQEIVAELVRTPGRDGSEQVSIRLRPEYLGEVVMRISVDGDGVVTARFIAEHAFVRSMIEQQLPELRASLSQHGLQLGDTTVSGGEAGLAWDNGSVPDQRAERAEQPPAYGLDSADENTNDDHRGGVAAMPTTGGIDIRV